MQDNNTARKKVYDVLRDKTGYSDSYEDFNKFMDENEEARKKYKVTSQMLHSFCMVFPEMSEPLAHLSEKSFEAPLPGEFKRMFGEVILGI